MHPCEYILRVLHKKCNFFTNIFRSISLTCQSVLVRLVKMVDCWKINLPGIRIYRNIIAVMEN